MDGDTRNSATQEREAVPQLPPLLSPSDRTITWPGATKQHLLPLVSQGSPAPRTLCGLHKPADAFAVPETAQLLCRRCRAAAGRRTARIERGFSRETGRVVQLAPTPGEPPLERLIYDAFDAVVEAEKIIYAGGITEHKEPIITAHSALLKIKLDLEARRKRGESV